MDDLISRKATIEYLEAHKIVAAREGIILSADEDAIIEFLNTRPAVDAELRRHGKWIKKTCHLYTGEAYETVTCSKCSEVYAEPIMALLYCPHCGAKMDGGDAK